MEITLDKGSGLPGLREFTKANPQFDLGRGMISVSGNKVAGYFTTVAISCSNYRRQHPTKASASYELKGGVHKFVLTDDYGERFEITISDDAEGRALAERQLESLISNELLAVEVNG